jgi:hypothetical protein
MHKLRPLSLVKYDFTTLPAEYHEQCPFKKDASYLFLGEIANMPGHGVLIDHKTGKIHLGYHTEHFAELSEEEA